MLRKNSADQRVIYHRAHPKRCFWVGALLRLMWFGQLMLPLSFRVTSLELGQSLDCPSASEVTLKNEEEIHHLEVILLSGHPRNTLKW